MTLRTPMMTGAALLLLAASPALAGHSTPAEREATRQLNMQAAKMAKASPSNTTAMPAQPQIADAAAGMPANSPPAAAPTPKVQTAAAEPVAATAPLSDVSNPPAKVGVANVKDSSGTIIGAVQRVEVTPQGQPTKVAVALIGADEKLVVLDASKVTYDQARNEITAQASADQIRAKSG